MVDHPWEPYPDHEHRRENACRHCFYRRDLHPPGDPERNPKVEVHIKSLAASLANIEAGDLIEFSQARTMPGPVLRFRTRDFGLDNAEEYADASNYHTWWLQQVGERDGDWGELHAAVQASMLKLMEAWHALRVARATENELMGEHPHRRAT